jgi:mRNA interferase RelE/StbE
MTFQILYHHAVIGDDIPRLSKTDKQYVRSAIEEKLILAPLIFGKPLRHSLRGYRALRCGDYRIVFRIKEKTIKVFLIAHRSVVYQEIKKRI